jgi:RNA polymerase sigma-70 factor (ECF subfamily)
MHTIHGIYEKDLIVRLKEGDQTAFELLFHFYYPGLVVYSTQFTTDRMEAEEIVQDFFVRLWQRHQQLILTDSLKSYLFLSVKNGCLNYLKHKKVEEKYIKQMAELSNQHLAYDPDLYIASELQEKVKNVIDLLPEKCREIFIMSRIQGLKNDEIATNLNISKRTVETQISKALKVLRIELKDYVGLMILLGILQ